MLMNIFRTAQLRALLMSVALLFWSIPSLALELVMVEQEICPYCKLFDSEVGEKYSSTEAGKRAPLRRVDLKSGWPEDLKGIRYDHLTPTFILIDNGKELGRFRGYPGPDEFWGLLEQLLAKAGS